MRRCGEEVPTVRTILDALERRADAQPSKTLFVFLGDGENVTASLTLGELAAGARRVAADVLTHARPGDRAAVLHPPGVDYIEAIFGCMYAGVIAVPAYPPHPARPRRQVARLAATLADCDARLALTTSDMVEPLARAAGTMAIPAGVTWLATDGGDGSGREPIERRPLDPSAPAYLQYTSGSTTEPRGVVISHANLVHNLAMTVERIGFEGSRGAYWLPPYHDMGLVAAIFFAVYSGSTSVLMPPDRFLQRPMRWLRAISDFRAEVSAAPNFAFDLCVRRTTAEERATLDLSTWRVAVNGAEPVRADTITRFTEAFEVAGFRPEAMMPAYGLAEATLLVTVDSAARPPSARRTPDGDVVSCGPPPDQDVVIVDAGTGAPVEPGCVGEIWISGPSVAAGYWSRPDDSQAVFAARINGEGHRGRFLRTGDLGFMANGELFVTGRLTDLIVVRGRNHYPQDIEATVDGSHPAIRPGCTAAFAVEDPVAGTGVVVVAEVDGEEVDLDPVCAAVRSAVVLSHGLSPVGVVLLPPRGARKTTSGKIERGATRADYLSGSLPAVASWSRPTPKLR